MEPKLLSRRTVLKSAAGAAATLLPPMLNLGRFQTHAQGRTYSARAIDLVGRSLVIDMLSLLHPLDSLYPQSAQQNPLELSAEQLAKLRSGGVNVFHPAIGVSGPQAKTRALRFVAGLNSVVAEYSGYLRRVDSAADLQGIEDSDKMGVIIGIQNSDHFRTLEDVNQFYHLGQRVSQLTYNRRNLLGTGATDRVDGGLSDFGVGIVGRMNQVGMAVDVSHCGDRTTLDTFEVSTQPVLITHSNARILSGGHPRCKTDEAIARMADTGGVMGVTGVRSFVRAKEPTDIEHMLDHYEHVINLVGVEHVGIGSDMDPDGYDDMLPEHKQDLTRRYKASYGFRDKLDTDGFDHPLRIYDLTEGLIRRGYGDADIELILGGNFKRVLTQIWGATAAA